IAANRRVLDQGFLLQWTHNGKTFRKMLREEDWEEIAFEATYPRATIRFREKTLPFTVNMQAGPVFIPLDEDNSALPATIFSIELENIAAAPLAIPSPVARNGAAK
ncbi:MAG: GH116 family glycosyl-hydrolase, partial [Flavihumibacter sp.]